MNIEYKDAILCAHKQLHALTIVDINQKLYISNDKLYIDETIPLLQPIIRFITNQNRYSIYIFLERILEKYLNDIVAFKRYNFVTGYEIELRKEITKDIMQFLENSKLGFLNLKQTYPDYKLLHTLLDNFSVKVKQHYMNDFSP
tara:strand:+ start:1610 stop:2041 length:432 start_codon:yes stop_codon:yes gene_type:complete